MIRRPPRSTRRSSDLANTWDAWNWLRPKSTTSGIPGGLRTTTVYVNLLSRKILIQFSFKRLNKLHFYGLNHIFYIYETSKGDFFVRGIARQKLGYYPLPQNEAERIRRFLSFLGDAVSVLDPCAGGGAAMATITSGAQTVRHAI